MRVLEEKWTDGSLEEREVLLRREETPKEIRRAIEVLLDARMPKEVEVLAYTWAGEKRVSLRAGGLELGDFDTDTFPEADLLWNAVMQG